MKELTHIGWIKAKAILFLFTGIFGGGLLLVQCPQFTTAALFAVSVWSFCRFYYCAFYVIERYVDPQYRFSGLWSFMVYLMRRRVKHNAPHHGH
jgi:hypothetical protein